MDNNDEILAELKRVGAWADMQRRMTKWSLILVAAILPLMFAGMFFADKWIDSKVDDLNSSFLETEDWYDVRRLSAEGKLEQALGIGENLIAKTPTYPDAHTQLAHLYLMNEDFENAQFHFEEAYRLFPSQDNKDALAAFRQRLKKR